MKRRHVSAVLAVGLSGAFLALLGLLLTPKTMAVDSPQQRHPVETPDLIIDVQVDDETVFADQVITYALLYTNTLGQELSDAIITSTLSVKQYYEGGYLSDPVVPTANFTHSGSYDDGFLLQWNLGSLAAYEAGWIVVTTTLPLEAEPPWKDSNRWPLLGMSAVITTSTPDVSVGNPQGLEGDSASVMVVGPVLQITKEGDPGQVRPGRLLTYTLTVENKDREDVVAARNLVISDVLPASTAFYSASGTGVYSPTAGWVVWHPPGALDRGSTMAVSFTVRLAASPPACPPPDIENVTYRVRSDETIRLVEGKKRSTGVDDVLEKTIETPDPPPEIYGVFPGGIVVYTVSIYNPRYDQPVTGLRLTDTLPGEPNLFTFVDMVGGGPTPVITYPQVVWDGLSVPAGGVTSFSFRARVPYHIDIGNGSKTYRNSLSASAPGLVICDMKARDPSRADVTRQIEPGKSVEPDHVLSGGTVVYEITLKNYGNNTISGIRLTDTLPSGGGADFYFVKMVDGPEPVAGFQRNPVVWDGLSVPGDGETSLSFEAVAIGWPLQEYGNNLSASSPETTIPDRLNKAKVKIDTPLSVDKTVVPGQTLVNETVDYEMTICNVATGTCTFDRIQDYLPTGFYADGANPLDIVLDPPVALPAGGCWPYAFEVEVTKDVGCDNLPRTYKNSAGNIWIHLIDPVDEWLVSVADLAPLRVEPHVTIEKDLDHAAVLPGETFVYTVTLVNASSLSIHSVTVTDTLPDGFEYVDMVEGDPPASVSPPIVEWQNQSIPAGGQLRLVFRVLVPEGTPLGSYKNEVVASSLDPVCIKGSGKTAKVEVVDQIVLLSKEVSPGEIPPLGTVRYEIKLKNRDSVTVTGVTVTETLPSALGTDFRFLNMVEGDPGPSAIDGRQVVWRDLDIPGGQTLRLRFEAQGALLFGNYDNQVVASCPRSPITPDEDDIKATVTVLPGVVLYKTVYPTRTLSGGTVVYTVTLNNQGTLALEDVRITDTLAAGFSYRGMLDGPTPVQKSPQVVWQLDELGTGRSQDFVFEAMVGFRVHSGTYFNRIEGFSPAALIPGVGDTAPVDVEALDFWFLFLPLVLRGYAP